MGCKALAEWGNCLPVPPVALKMYLGDMTVFADCFNQCKGFLIQVHKAAGINHLKLMVDASDFFKLFPVQGKICAAVWGKIKMVVAEAAPSPRTAKAPQHYNFTGIFFIDDRIAVWIKIFHGLPFCAAINMHNESHCLSVPDARTKWACPHHFLVTQSFL